MTYASDILSIDAHSVRPSTIMRLIDFDIDWFFFVEIVMDIETDTLL